ncbi:MAG: hypothetical protein LAT57_00805 [Balneolales bacterium]|nr:hypothetical protein [Balneolales bacterium]
MNNSKQSSEDWFSNPSRRHVVIFWILWTTGSFFTIIAETDLFTQKGSTLTYVFLILAGAPVVQLTLNYLNKKPQNEAGADQ